MNKFGDQQAGLSMIELLIALAMSSFLIIGLSQVYIDHKRNYVFQQSQSANLENSRFAVLILDELLSKAGYRRAPYQPISDAFPESTALNKHCETFAEKSVISKVKVAAGSGQTGFCLRYQPAVKGEFICDGSAAGLVQPTAFIYPEKAETVYIAVLFEPHSQEANEGALRCISRNSNVQLLTGLADMRVEFGTGQVDEKRLSHSMPFKTAESWSERDSPIRVVRYSVLAASRSNQRDGESKAYKQWLAAASATSKTRLIAQDKKQLYQVVMGTQALRNMMP